MARISGVKVILPWVRSLRVSSVSHMDKVYQDPGLLG